MSRDYVLVDVEADGPAPGLFSMVSFGAVVVNDRRILDETFYGQTAPLPDASYNPDALAISGHSREEHLGFPAPQETMKQFETWVKKLNRPTFVADNNGFDWQFINYYLHAFTGGNPFGFSSMNLNSLLKGAQRNMYASLKPLRQTKHDHHPVNDAKGNAEAFITIAQQFDIKGI